MIDSDTNHHLQGNTLQVETLAVLLLDLEVSKPIGKKRQNLESPNDHRHITHTHTLWQGQRKCYLQQGLSTSLSLFLSLSLSY